MTLSPPGSAVAAISRSNALDIAETQPVLAQVVRSDPNAKPIVKLAIYDSLQVSNSGSNRYLAWVVFVARVSDPLGGPLGGERQGTTTTSAQPPLVDLITIVNASTGAPGPSYSQSSA